MQSRIIILYLYRPFECMVRRKTNCLKGYDSVHFCVFNIIQDCILIYWSFSINYDRSCTITVCTCNGVCTNKIYANSGLKDKTT